jgi:hypothetical protein
MNWDVYTDYRHLSWIYETYAHRDSVVLEMSRMLFQLEPDSPRRRLERSLLKDLNGSVSVHPRRTLDQFYYPSLTNTRVRDADQTISKWTGEGVGKDGRERAAGDSLLLMVDQLWCWVLDERKCHVPMLGEGVIFCELMHKIGTVISCFPSHVAQYEGNGFQDLYTTVVSKVARCRSVWEIYSLLTKEAITHLFAQENRTIIDLVETYRWVTGKKVSFSANFLQPLECYS